jgi:hypothetical protein
MRYIFSLPILLLGHLKFKIGTNNKPPTSTLVYLTSYPHPYAHTNTDALPIFNTKSHTYPYSYSDINSYTIANTYVVRVRRPMQHMS